MTKGRREPAGREAIAGAARRLFAKRGYEGTTIEAIAAAAGYAVPTVYFHFGTKAAIVEYLLDRMRDEAIMPTFEESMRADDSGRIVELTAHIARLAAERWLDLYVVIRSAARSDPAIRKLYAREESGRLYGATRVAELVHRNGDLKSGLDVAKATAILWTLGSDDTYQRLVVERGWSLDEYERWLAACLTRELLGDDSTSSTGSSAGGPGRNRRKT